MIYLQNDAAVINISSLIPEVCFQDYFTFDWIDFNLESYAYLDDVCAGRLLFSNLPYFHFLQMN